MNGRRQKPALTEEELRFRLHWAIVLCWFVLMVGIGVCLATPTTVWFLDDHAELGQFPTESNFYPCQEIDDFFWSLLHPGSPTDEMPGAAPPIDCSASAANSDVGQPSEVPPQGQSAQRGIQQAIAQVNQNLMAAVSAREACRAWNTYNGPESCLGDDAISNFMQNIFDLAWRTFAEFWDEDFMPSWNRHFRAPHNSGLAYSFIAIIYSAVLAWCVQTALTLLHAPIVDKRDLPLNPTHQNNDSKT